MIRILLGGSPCTHFSIAQKNNRETQPNSGIGWELFKNYLIAKEKFNPDYFLYENNVSAAKPIKDQIRRELNVWDGTFLMPYTDVRYIEINSALVSAQNRERFYVHNCGEVGQPKDRGISVKDILEKKNWTLKDNVAKCKTVQKALRKLLAKYGYIPKMFNAYNIQEITDKTPTLSTGSMVTSSCATLIIESENIIRRLTIAECRRLQTIPDWYKMPCSDTQNYKMLGNGWTVEVIKHILSHIPNITKEPIEVLSMYDGMSCGRIALKELGANVVRYYATEIDKYAIQTTQANFPDTIQLGDAFQVRADDWSLPI